MANAIVVKQEPADSAEIENRLFRLCDDNPKGILIHTFQTEITECSTAELMKMINALLSSKKIQLVTRRGQQFIIRAGPPSTNAAKKVTGLSDHNEKLVYQIIEAAANKGIWEKDIRDKSKIAQQPLTKILKSLETRELIKSVKSVAANRKKIYMLHGLEPDVSVTGGTWYSGQSFDSVFVQIITERCLDCVLSKAKSIDVNLGPAAQREASFATSNEILESITAAKISRVQLSVADIDAIMNSLIYDLKVERVVVMGSEESINSYRAIAPIIPPTGLMRMPCGFCPVIEECHEGGAISPSTCRYMQEWLEKGLDF